MMWAAIDAGSNTLRLLIGEVVAGNVIPELYLRRICRLAGGFSTEEGLSPAAQERTLLAFSEFAETCHQFEIQKVRAVGTAAFRQAVNGAVFAAKIREATKIPLEIISGEEEATYMVAGVLSALDPVPKQALIVDIGGGSTEFVVYAHQRVIWLCSLPLGVVRLLEEYPSQQDRYRAISEILEVLIIDLFNVCKSNEIDFTGLALVGTAGTLTTLAALNMQMVDYDWRRVNNYSLPLSRLQYWQSRLTPLSPVERETLPGMEPGRGDLIMPGFEIILCLMQKMGRDCLTVSDFGILEGLLLSLQKSS